MKRTLVTLVTTVGIVGGVGTLGAVNYEPPTSAATNSTHARPQPPRWSEDSLPPELHLWQAVHGGELKGPRVADRWARAATGRTHRGCWAATGDTTLIMCPDGTIAYS